MNLAELELQRVDWSSIRCGYGTSTDHVRTKLLRMINEEEKAEGQLGSHLFGPSVIYGPAVPVVTIAMAVLAGRASIEVRASFAELLLFILSAEGQSIESACEGRNLIEECRSAAIPGMWLLYSEVLAEDRGDVGRRILFRGAFVA